MFCTSKDQETCRVEKRGCNGCYYEIKTSEKMNKNYKLKFDEDEYEKEIRKLFK